MNARHLFPPQQKFFGTVSRVGDSVPRGQVLRRAGDKTLSAFELVDTHVVGDSEDPTPQIALSTTAVHMSIKPQEGLLDDFVRLSRGHTQAKKIAIDRLPSLQLPLGGPLFALPNMFVFL